MNTCSPISIEEIENALRTFDFPDLKKEYLIGRKLDYLKTLDYNLDEQLEQEKNKFWQERQEAVLRFSKNMSEGIREEDTFFELAVKCFEKQTGRTIALIMSE